MGCERHLLRHAETDTTTEAETDKYFRYNTSAQASRAEAPSQSTESAKLPRISPHDSIMDVESKPDEQAQRKASFKLVGHVVMAMKVRSVVLAYGVRGA